MDLFFYEAFKEEEEALRSYLKPPISAEFTWKTIQEYGVPNPPAPIISIRTQSIIPVSWAEKLSGILSRSTGYDHIERFLKQCKKDVPCGYLPLYCNRAVAEQAFLLILSILRKLPQQIDHFASFNRDGLTGRECENKTLLVVGVGHIGSEIVKIGQGMGMKVFGVDLVKKYSWVSYTTIEEGISGADVIACAMNLTSDNVGYFNYKLLKKAKKGVVFVNVARGELSPSVDLLRLLDEEHIGGLALDVYSRESELAVSLRSNSSAESEEVRATLELAKRKNVILTPHNSFNTEEAVDRKASHSFQQLFHFLEHGSFLWPVPYSQSYKYIKCSKSERQKQ